MNQFELDIQTKNQECRDAIFKSFVNHEEVVEISKGISIDEFKEQYSAGHEIFTKSNLDTFEKSVREELFDSTEEEISKAIESAKEGLQPVLVNNNEDKKTILYVRKAV